MASENVQPSQDRPTEAHAGNPASAPQRRALRPAASPPAPANPPPAPADNPAGTGVADPSTHSPSEPPIFGGIAPPLRDWYRNPQAEAINRTQHDAEEAAQDALVSPVEESLDGLDEEFLNSRRRRQELLAHLFSPFYILPLFVLVLLLGISTVKISIPESATVRASIAFVNYNKLAADQQAEFQIDQEQLLKSDELRAMARGILSQGPRTVDPSYVTDTLEYHRALDRKWYPDGRLDLTVRSEDPDTDVLRLRTMANAYVLLGQQRQQDIAQYQAAAEALEAQNADTEKRSSELRQQIDDLSPLALQQSTLTAAAYATEQYLSRLSEGAPERVAAGHNLERLIEQVKAAREAGESRDKLVAQRIDLIQKINDTTDQIAQKRDLADRVVYPKPFTAGDVTVTDLRPASFRAMWAVTVVICALFALLVALAYLRNLRRETAALRRATADTTAPN